MTGLINVKGPLMIAVGGLSASGKTTLAVEIGKHMPSAVVLDADVFRKKLHGVDPTTPLPDHAYSKKNTKTFIRKIHREAERYMKEGKTVIVTGIFLDKQSRQKQEELARNTGADFIGIYLHASPAVLFNRIAQRKGSASDADRKVLQKQIQAMQDEQQRELESQNKRVAAPRPFGEINWQIINADQNVDDMLKSALIYIHQETRKNFSLLGAKKSQVKQKPNLPTP